METLNRVKSAAGGWKNRRPNQHSPERVICPVGYLTFTLNQISSAAIPHKIFSYSNQACQQTVQIVARSSHHLTLFVRHYLFAIIDM